MKLISSLLLAFILMNRLAWGEPPQVLFLGVYHFVPSETDSHRFPAADILGKQKQEEISGLISRLAKFRPTKIAFEVPFGMLASDPGLQNPTAITPGRIKYYNENAVSEVDRQYADYLAGKFELTAREAHQIGFRLAKLLGQSKVYACDYKADLPPVTPESESDIKMERGIQDEFAPLFEQSGNASATGTLLAALRFFNSPDFGRIQQIYLRQTQIFSKTEPTGAEVTATWYRRNLIIFGKLRSLTSDSDRILLIYGAGHGPLLREFISNCGDMRLIDISPFLSD